MKSNTRLDSAVFHLTPTRTRCDLFIIADGKREKVASGLLNPFLPHLKTARDQIEKGGYSITLEPEQEDADWFTKATVERFVRFVSTPEILERVITVESEILQIQEAIALQGSNDAGQNHAEDQEVKYNKVIEGTRTNAVPDDDKAIVLYKPEAQEAQPNGQCSQEGNSKAQLMKVLETRKNVLRKEQGMAFARAMAAGFDVDQMAPLVSFAENFGAPRLKDACSKFVELWRRKHETGQWLEIEASEALSGRSDFAAMNASGIVFSGDVHKQNESTENNEKSAVDLNSGERTPPKNQSPNGQPEYFQGQFPHAMYPSWPMHTSPGSVPMFPPYPVQRMPYYQPYPGSVPYYQPPYPHMEDPRLSSSPTTLQKRHSMGARNGSSDMETWELDTSKSRSQDAGELDKEVSESWQSRKKSGRSGKKQSGMVVIRNINYITSDKKNSADSGSESTSTETDTDGEDQDDDVGKSSLRTLKSSKRKGSHSVAKGTANYDNEDNMYAKGTDNWQAFQSFLLKSADEEGHAAKEGMFGMENGGKTKRRQNNGVDDPLALAGIDSNGVHDRRMSSMHEVNGSTSRLRRGSNDDVMLSGGYNGARETGDGINLHASETKGRRLVSREDEFMMGNRDGYPEQHSSLDPLSVDRIRRANALKDGESSRGPGDESFIVPFRSMSLNGAVEGRTVINMDSEKSVNTSGGMGRQVYEPEDVSMIPERGTEKNSAGYDLALDYEMHAGLDKGTKAAVNAKGNSKKSVNGRSMKGTSDALDKKKVGGPMRKGKPSKTSPLEDAKARADKIRAFKADVQKMKKEKEEADLKRLEAVKLERQKRIAARCGTTSSGSTAPPPQTKKLPLKSSPISYRGSKFSDSEPGSSSPLQRSKVRTSVGSNAPHKAPRSSKSVEGTPLPGNRLTRSVSSLSDPRKESSGISVTPDSKASSARIRRLSEPKTVSTHTATSMKMQNAKPVLKLKSSDRPDSKKISAIINLDKSKTAALPELKLKTPKEQSNATNKKLLAGVKHSASSGPSELLVEIPKSSNDIEVDDNPIVEKNIVVLENDKPSSLLANASGEKVGLQNPHTGNHSMLKPVEEVSQNATIPGPPPHVVGKGPMLGQFEKHPNTPEVKPHQVEEPSKSADNQSAGKRPYEAPYARNSSLEDPSTRKSNHGKAPPSTSSTGLTPAAKVYVVNEGIPQVEYIPESLAQIQVKESPKGFKRLLMFGKKSHTSSTPADQSNESDKASVGSVPPDNATTNSANEVFTLKNLINEDETQSSGASQKSSRHFSLLSPFRSKTSDKKLTT